MKTPSSEDLECLNLWPVGSSGYEIEKLTIQTIAALCEISGFGRVPQIAASIEEIWRRPESIEKFKKEQEERFEMLANSFKEGT
jgi:hypothetical protein